MQCYAYPSAHPRRHRGTLAAATDLAGSGSLLRWGQHDELLNVDELSSELSAGSPPHG